MVKFVGLRCSDRTMSGNRSKFDPSSGDLFSRACPLTAKNIASGGGLRAWIDPGSLVGRLPSHRATVVAARNSGPAKPRSNARV